MLRFDKRLGLVTELPTVAVLNYKRRMNEIKGLQSVCPVCVSFMPCLCAPCVCMPCVCARCVCALCVCALCVQPAQGLLIRAP